MWNSLYVTYTSINKNKNKVNKVSHYYWLIMDKHLFCGWKVKMKEKVRQSSVWLCVTPWTVACQAPLSIGLSSKNTGVVCHTLLQGIFLTQGQNLNLLHCRRILHHLSHLGIVQIGRSPEELAESSNFNACKQFVSACAFSSSLIRSSVKRSVLRAASTDIVEEKG